MRTFAAFLAAVPAALLALPALADGTSGSYTAIKSQTRAYTTIDHAGETVTGGSLTGTITILESSGEPFVEGGNSEVKCVVFARRADAGVHLEAPCTHTDAAGDEFYKISKRDMGGIEAGGGGAGRMELSGGTGKYAGVTGSCTYDTGYLENDLLVTMMDCTWQRP